PCDDTVPGTTCPAVRPTEDVPLPDLTHTTACGALGFHLKDASLPISEMTECCNVHGACYGAQCRSKKRSCDRQLRKCLAAVCKNDKSLDRSLKKSCKAAAKLLFTGTMSMSFMQYKRAQELLLC
ncbi:Group XII secretory phospholipase A2 precursor, partial [Trinorchestia longiramus]